MNKFFALVLSLVLTACASLPATQTDMQTYCVPMETDWNFYVFDIESETGYGRAFIANYGIWTAKHIFDEGSGALDDVKFMGPTEVKGYVICTHELKLEDMVYYRVKGKIKYLRIAHIEDEYFGVLALNSIECGDSGSPVISLKDGEVVGIVSQMIGKFGGKISRIKIAIIKDE